MTEKQYLKIVNDLVFNLGYAVGAMSVYPNLHQEDMVFFKEKIAIDYDFISKNLDKIMEELNMEELNNEKKF